MIDLKVDISCLSPLVADSEVRALFDDCTKAYDTLLSKDGKGNDFLGWLDLPSSTGPELIGQIRDAAVRVSGIAEVFVVIGIGGSYLGARAVIDALGNAFASGTDKKQSPLILYAGHNLSEDYLCELAGFLDKKDYALAVISKSGTTTEPAIAFRLLKDHAEKKYGKEEASRRIIAITDRERGALKTLADREQYMQFVIPDDVGGRYSVLTPVGLLPVAAAGYDIEALLAGAELMENQLKSNDNAENNPAILYACARQACLRKGYKLEILVNYEPYLYYFSEWWKQLFGESEGKEHKGIFPASVNFTTDLHSMGQYIQEGPRMLFETVLSVDNPRKSLIVPGDKENIDGINFLAGKHLSEINRMAGLATQLAHNDGGVPVISIKLPRIDEHSLGQLIYFFEFSCALSGYMLGVNPFDQPGVEAYKKNMFALLGKPGFEKQKDELLKRLGSH